MMKYSKIEIIKIFEQYDYETAGEYINTIHGAQLGEVNDSVKYNTLYTRLADIINFLSKREVVEALDLTSSDFYSRFMTISKPKPEVVPEYQYNLYDAIILAVLMGLYNEPYFKTARSKIKQNKEGEAGGDKWDELVQKKLLLYKNFWERDSTIIKKSGIEPEGLQPTNNDFYSIQFVLHGIVNVKSEQEILKSIDERMSHITQKLRLFPPDERIELYNTKIKTKLNSIEKAMEEYIQDMDETTKRNYMYYKKLEEIDIEIEKSTLFELEDNA